MLNTVQYIVFVQSSLQVIYQGLTMRFHYRLAQPCSVIVLLLPVYSDMDGSDYAP